MLYVMMYVYVSLEVTFLLRNYKELIQRVKNTNLKYHNFIENWVLF